VFTDEINTQGGNVAIKKMKLTAEQQLFILTGGLRGNPNPQPVKKDKKD
jgi:hypothetical protein